jgi:hypothetical protein
MRSLGLALLLVFASQGCAREEDPAPPRARIQLEPAVSSVPAFAPARSIGPIALGMARSELEKLGLPIVTEPHSTVALDFEVLLVGPYRVVVKRSVVWSIEVELSKLPSGLSVGKTVIPSGVAHIEDIAALVEGCGKVDHRDGGNVITCTGGTTLIKAGGPVGIVSVQVLAEKL